MAGRPAGSTTDGRGSGSDLHAGAAPRWYLSPTMATSSAQLPGGPQGGSLYDNSLFTDSMASAGAFPTIAFDVEAILSAGSPPRILYDDSAAFQRQYGAQDYADPDEDGLEYGWNGDSGAPDENYDQQGDDDEAEEEDHAGPAGRGQPLSKGPPPRSMPVPSVTDSADTKQKPKSRRGRKKDDLAERNAAPPLRRACNFCTRRRRKCDGAQPICGTCQARNGECEYDVNRKKLVRDSPWHDMVKTGTAGVARKAIEEIKAIGEEVDVRALADILSSQAAQAPAKGSKRQRAAAAAKKSRPPAQMSPLPVKFEGFTSLSKESSMGSGRSAESVTLPQEPLSAPLFPPLLPPFASATTVGSASRASSAPGIPPLGGMETQSPSGSGPLAFAGLAAANVSELPRNVSLGSASMGSNIAPLDVDALLEYANKVLQVQTQQKQELALQLQNQTDFSTEEGLKRAFIRDIVPAIPKHIRYWLFDKVQEGTEFAIYCPDKESPAAPLPGPDSILPLLTACKKLIVRHVTLPMFLPSLFHIILFSTVLCVMAVDPDSELGNSFDDVRPTGPPWTPLGWPNTAKEVYALLRICIGMSKRMGMNKEPIGRQNADPALVQQEIRESKIITSEVDLGDQGPVLLNDGAGASMDPERENMTRRLWWLQYIADRELAYLTFRQPIIDDKDCYIYPPHMAEDATDQSAHSPRSGTGSAMSLIQLSIPEAAEFETLVSDALFRSFSILGRSVNYRYACQIHRLDPTAEGDPNRRDLFGDAQVFRAALPKIADAYDKRNTKPGIVNEYKRVISHLPRMWVQQLASGLLVHNAAVMILASPPVGNDSGSYGAWENSSGAPAFATAAFRVVNILNNMIWNEMFGSHGGSQAIVGFNQVIVFQAAMALATLVIALQNKTRRTRSSFRLDHSITVPVHNLAIHLTSGDFANAGFPQEIETRLRSYIEGLEALLNAFELFKIGVGGRLAEQGLGMVLDVLQNRKPPCPMMSVGKAWLSQTW